MKKPRAAFIVADKKVENQYNMLIASLRKFHSEEELPVIRIDEEKIKTYNDPQFFYRSKALIAKELIKKYECVIALDSDQIVTGKLDEIWNEDYDVAVVNNSNPREFNSYPYRFLNVHPFSYVNCGLVAMRSESFIDFWNNFNHSMFFPVLQMREQDTLNLLVHSNNFTIKRLDEGDSFYGLANKGYTPYAILRDGKIILPANSDADAANAGKGWPDKEKQIRVYHWAAGHDAPDKMNYRTIFSEEVVKYIDTLVK